MAPIRVRHPKGVSTIQIDFNTDTVQDLQHKILAVSEIIPSQQERTYRPNQHEMISRAKS